MRLLLPLVLALLWPVPATAADGAERLRTFLDEVSTFSADFEQTVYDENLKVLEESSGTLRLKRPGRFRFEYRAPYEQLIVADGAQVWLYDKELAQVTVKPIDEALGNTPALLLTSGEPVDEQFRVRDLGGEGGQTWVELLPRSPDASFTAVRLAFGADGLEQMELSDSFGQLTRLHFKDIARNAPMDDAVFDFTPPAGVDVIGGRDH